jgi:formimidoylglutamate deiminase
MSLSFQPDLLFRNGSFLSHEPLHVDASGVIQSEQGDTKNAIQRLSRKALLPGFINIHSHSFQRLIRGKAESRIVSGKDFWSWRGTMYHAAAMLSPLDIYDAARMAFLEMVRAGTTTVGEFHYLHNAPDGCPYSDPNELSHQLIAAAQSVGIRLVLLRCAYLRSGYNLPPDPGQARFFETSDAFLANMEALIAGNPADSNLVRFGVAPHSVRAVPLDDLRQIVAWGRSHHLAVHMHVAEQVAENSACLDEYGSTPIDLLARTGILGSDFTAIHAIHIAASEISQLASSGATIGSCPTTERNLGDGILAADEAMRAGIPIALGSDSQAQIDPLEDARQLEYHLRLAHQQRVILDQIEGRTVHPQPIANRLFDCATRNGARSLGIASGDLIAGNYGDFVTVALDDLSIAGSSPSELLPILTFGMNRTAIRDVAVNGRLILKDGHHALEEEIVARYKSLHDRVWPGARG